MIEDLNLGCGYLQGHETGYLEFMTDRLVQDDISSH